MIDQELEPEQCLSLARAAFDALDHLLAVAPQEATISFREISAQVHVLRQLCRRASAPWAPHDAG